MEIFHTFLAPIVFKLDGQQYYCWGYCEVDADVIAFSATLNKDQKWTDSTYFREKNLLDEFKKCLPERPVKRKRRKKRE